MHDPAVVGTGTAQPVHDVDQEQAKVLAGRLFADRSDGAVARLMPVFDNVEVERRQVCMPPEWYLDEHSFETCNDEYRRNAVELGAAAASTALTSAGVAATDVGSIVFVSTTGLATPSLDVALMAELGLPSRHTHRQAIFGRGCAGGAVGLAAAADRARLGAGPVLLVVVELCSLTFRRRDLSKANIVSSALFGDGAAAVVVADPRTLDRRDAPVIVGHDGVTWPATEDLMGWHFGDDGMTVQLSRRIPALVRREFRRCFEDACARYDVDPGEVRHHLVHPGSGVVLDAVSAALDLPSTALDRSRATLREHGNMSAATVLFILDRFVRDGAAEPGDIAALSAMGPGFSADHVLLRC